MRDPYADLEQVYLEETKGAAVDKGLLTPRKVVGAAVLDRKRGTKPSLDQIEHLTHAGGVT